MMLTFDEILERLANASPEQRKAAENDLADAKENIDDYAYVLDGFGKTVFEIIYPPEQKPEPIPPPVMVYEQAPFYCRQCEKAEAFNLKGDNWVCSKCGYVRYAFPSIERLKND